ncbi:MAG: hypothetical protein HZA79_13425 [Sphingobacteriales bacterium]|nr:hypothetical protein [Sphingobacteriales bacterium]
MNKIAKFLIIALFGLEGQSFCQIPKLSDYSLKVENKSKVAGFNKTVLLFQATLFNQSKDTLRYHSMSCSWQDYYSVNNSKLKITPSECDKNIPTVLTLAPQQVRQVILEVEIPKNQNLADLVFRIGFHLLVDRIYMDNYEVGEEF